MDVPQNSPSGSTIVDMRLGMFYFGSPLVKESQGRYRANSIMTMIEHFPGVFEVDLVCGVSHRGGEEMSSVDLSSLQVIPLAPWKSSMELHTVRFLPVALVLLWNTVRKRKEWDAVWLIDCVPMTQLCFLFARLCRLPTILYLRGDIKKEVALKDHGGLKGIIARAYASYVDATAALMLRHGIGVVAGRTLYERYDGSAKYLHRYVASSTSKRVMQYTGSSLGTADGELLRLLYVGNLVTYKGISILLKAMRDLRDEGVALHLDIVGRGPIRESLNKEVKALGLERSISMKGFIPFGEELFAVYRKSDVYILPSFTEGTPKTILEAMSFGLAIIATEVGGIPDLVEDGLTGFLFEPGDVKGLAARIRMLAEDRCVLDRMSRNALNRAPEYTVEKQVRKLENFLAGVL